MEAARNYVGENTSTPFPCPSGPMYRQKTHFFQAEAVFDAVVVTRTSPEGRMMSKWLRAARTKLGGEHLFPKPEAKAQMER